MSNEQLALRALKTLKKTGAITEGHFVYASGKHGAKYVNKDALYPHTRETSRLCRYIAKEFAHEEIDTVIAPEKGGIILSQWVAHHLTKVIVNLVRGEISAVYAEKAENNLFAINRDYDKFISGRCVLVVEDVLTTGGSVRKVVEAVRVNGGGVIGVGALWNRGGVTREDIGDVPRLFSLVNTKLDDWTEGECPLCKEGVPVNTDLGKGAEFLARKAKEATEEYERKHRTIPG